MGRGPGPLPLPIEGGSDAALAVQVAMNDLSPAGPIQAVEILMESPSLAHMCRTHHAVIRRIQVPPGGQGGPQVTPKPLERSLGCSGGSFCGTTGTGGPLRGPRFGVWPALWVGLPRAQTP